MGDHQSDEADNPGRLGWNDVDEIGRHDRAYHEREQEQWGGVEKRFRL